MIGIDIIEIERVGAAIKKPRFLETMFSDYERAYIAGKGKAAETAAGLFAAKEAVAKALGTGFSRATARDIEITHTKDGAPRAIYKPAPELKIELSISHCKAYAAAAAIIR